MSHNSDDFSSFVNFVEFQITWATHISITSQRVNLGGRATLNMGGTVQWAGISDKKGTGREKGGLLGSTVYCPHLCFLHHQSMSTLFNHVLSAMLDWIPKDNELSKSILPNIVTVGYFVNSDEK